VYFIGSGMTKSAQSVLLVEDHADSAETLARILGTWGYDVSISANVADARELASRKRFDLALCDLGLPDGDGCDLMQELVTRYGLKGIALTGYGMPQDVQRAARAGFSAHVVKPVDFERLRQAVQKVAGESGNSNPSDQK
jgi:CheY-like chemotaxis protein